MVPKRLCLNLHQKDMEIVFSDETHWNLPFKRTALTESGTIISFDLVSHI